MPNRRTAKTPPAPRIVDSGDGWTIEYDPTTRDYAAIVEDEFIGCRETETAARTLIANHRTSNA